MNGKKTFSIVALSAIAISPLISTASYIDRSTITDDNSIIEALYGNGNSYTTERNSQCDTNLMHVEHISQGTTFDSLGSLITGNVIYYLEDNGEYPLTTRKLIKGHCVAVISKNNEAKLYTTGYESELLKIYGESTGIIIEGLYLDGIKGNPDHSKDMYGISLQASRGDVKNNSFNNNAIYNFQYGIYIAGRMDTSNNIFTNNTIADSDYGVYVNEITSGSTSGLVISGNELIENGTGISDNSSSGATVDGNTFSGNDTSGNTGTNATGSDFPSDHLTDEQQCNNFGGCYCTPQADAVIADTTRCTDTTKTTRTTEGSAYDCNDHDECTCSFDSSNYAYGSTSVSCTDGTQTTLSNGQQCTDPDDCSCNGTELAMGAYCRIASSGGGGGGGSSSSRDDCPNGDYSSSYYDGTCGVAPGGDLTLGGVVDDDTFGSYSVSDKAQLLAGEYKALVDAGETTLRHGEFFAILFKYAELKNISDAKLKLIITVLRDIFADMSEAQLAKFGFDKTILLQELERLIA